MKGQPQTVRVPELVSRGRWMGGVGLGAFHISAYLHICRRMVKCTGFLELPVEEHLFPFT